MKKKLFSIALIVVLISFTVAPLWGYSSYVHADVQVTASDDQKEKGAVISYLNFRGGYFVNKVGSSVSAASIAINYLHEFYLSDANNTGIRSTADFISHVQLFDDNGHWSFKIDNTGVVFLDHLIKWLLGKNEFPNLYSGGSWGEGSTTSDNVYDGYLFGNNLFCHAYGSFGNDGGLCDRVVLGTAWDGMTPEFLKDYYNQQNNITVNYDEYHSGQNGSVVYITYNRPTANSVSEIQTGFGCATASSYSNYRPVLSFGPVGSTFPQGFIYGNRGAVIRGYPCMIIVHDSNNPPFYAFGCLTYNATSQQYYIFYYYVYNNLPSLSTPNQVDFDTYQFDKSDVGSDSENAPDINFTPKEESGDGDNITYNYYDYNEYNENTFIEEYIKKYVQKKTIVNGSNNDSGDNPGGGGGGSVTPGTGSGSITPDGNGGYNFNLPDIGWPDFSGFDFNISGLSQKFPFSIPFDLMAFFTVLNAEPETPEIQGQIDLGIVQWDIDWNLEDFDGLASLLRNLEFIGFCLALILITRSIIKG